MKKLLKYLTNYKKESIIAPLFKMLEAGFELLVPIVMANIVDIGIKNRNEGFIWKMCVLMMALGFLGLVCSLTAQYFAAKAAWGFGTALREDMYQHIQNLSYRELDQVGTPTLVNRITTDIMQVQTGVNMALRLFLRSPFLVAGALIMALTISPMLTIIFIVAVMGIGLVLYVLTKVTIPMYGKIQKILDEIILHTRENYIGARVVRAFSREKREEEDFDEMNLQMKRVQTRAGNISALMNPLTFVLINLAIMVILWAGGWQVQIGNISQGQVIALINYMNQILLALTALANLMIVFNKAIASADRVNQIFELHSTMKNGNSRENPEKELVVVFDHVTFSYEKAQESSLEDISFTIPKGATVGIIGATGSGKSTLLQLIPRFYDCSAGKIYIDGKEIRTYDTKILRQKIGVVPQKAVLVQGTIKENLLWGNPKASESDIWRCLKTAQAEEIVKQRKKGLEASVETLGRNFSGGQKQRLTIARALIRKPEILILDDSTSALDYMTDEALRHALRENKKEMTVFIASQRVAAVQNADFILVLDDGKLAGKGTHEELKNTCEVYREICNSQCTLKEEAI